MRIALYVLVAALALPSMGHAQTTAEAHTEEYTPPRITVFGENTGITVADVTQVFVREKPGCVQLAAEAQNQDPTRTRKSVQDAVFVRCMAEAFAPLGLSVIEDAPQDGLAKT